MKNIDDNNVSINIKNIIIKEKEEYSEFAEKDKAIREFLLPVNEYSEVCVKCQLRHLKTKGFKDGKFPVACKGIPKVLQEEKYYPLDKIYPEEEYRKLSIKDKIRLQYKNNVLLWAEQMLGWTPFNENRNFYQFYQEEMLLCTAKLVAARLGRRMGKSEVIVIRVLHYGMTTFIKNPQILIIAPFNNLCDELHKRFLQKLDESVFAQEYTSTKKPYTITLYRKEFGDTCTIKLFTTGSGSGNAGASTRGQAADFLLIDEGGYVDQESLEAVLPLILEHKEVSLLVTSTPSQMPNKFKQWCLQEQEWKDFHYPFSVMPDFEPGKKEYEFFKKQYTLRGWKQEIDAEFFEGDAKVFKTDDLIHSLQPYTYPETILDIPDSSDWRFMIGVDWNAAKHGVQIVLQGINLKLKQTKVWKRVSISNEKKELQLRAIEAIKKMDRDFGAEKIIVDQGYGATQIELLVKYYSTISQEEKIIPVDFSSTISQVHPVTKERFNKRIKGVMVALLQQRFEYGTITISSTEEGTIPSSNDSVGQYLITQLDNYKIDKYDSRSNPVFKADGPGTDHALDALLLSNYGINKFIEKVFDMNMGDRPSVGVSSSTNNQLTNFINKLQQNVEGRFSSNPMKSNFTEIYSNKAKDEEFSERIGLQSRGRLVKIFGTASKRLNRSKF